MMAATWSSAVPSFSFRTTTCTKGILQAAGGAAEVEPASACSEAEHRPGRANRPSKAESWAEFQKKEEKKKKKHETLTVRGAWWLPRRPACRAV